MNPITLTYGERIPLNRLASVEITSGPSTISRDWGQRRITITCNVRGRDMVGFVEEARRKIDEQVAMPSGRYHVEFGGQFEHYVSAIARLWIVVLVAVVAVGAHDLRVDQLVQLAVDLDHAGAQRLAQLGGREADAGGVAHGVGQVVEELVEGLREAVDGLALEAEARVAEQHDGFDAHGGEVSHDRPIPRGDGRS